MSATDKKPPSTITPSTPSDTAAMSIAMAPPRVTVDQVLGRFRRPLLERLPGHPGIGVNRMLRGQVPGAVAIAAVVDRHYRQAQPAQTENQIDIGVQRAVVAVQKQHRRRDGRFGQRPPRMHQAAAFRLGTGDQSSQKATP